MLSCQFDHRLPLLLLRSHISNSCDDDQVYVHAISDARCVFDMGVCGVK